MYTVSDPPRTHVTGDNPTLEGAQTQVWTEPVASQGPCPGTDAIHGPL